MKLGDPAPGGGRYIPLTEGYAAIVNDEDFERISRHTWYAVIPGGKHVYAIRHTSKRNHSMSMHREILGLSKGESTDHRDGNTLNNRRSNLRKCTQGENVRNSKKHGKRSRFKGVYPVKCKWGARIFYNKRLFSLGSFPAEEDAARAYDKAARELHGEFACVNFPDHAGERCCLPI